jgi:hypothetical protein
VKTFPRELIVQALDESAEDVASTIREDYSGRGDHGVQCFGLVLDVPVAMLLVQVAACISEEYEDRDERATMMDNLINLTDDMREDSMGRSSTIAYFPGWTLED